MTPSQDRRCAFRLWVRGCRVLSQSERAIRALAGNLLSFELAARPVALAALCAAFSEQVSDDQLALRHPCPPALQHAGHPAHA